MPVVNLEGVAVGFEALEEGTYKGRFSGFKNGISKERKQPKADLEFTLTEPSEVAGRKVFYTASFAPTALSMFKALAVRMGVEPEDLDVNGLDTDDILNPLIGSEHVIKVTQYEYEGKTRNRMDVIDPEAWGG